MTCQLLHFPKPARKRRSSRSSAGPTAQVRAFPPSRQRRVVEFIGREMSDKRTIADAEDVLAQHLEIEARRLQRAGINEIDAIEEALSGFARAAWAVFDRADDSQGAA